LAPFLTSLPEQVGDPFHERRVHVHLLQTLREVGSVADQIERSLEEVKRW
jgi:hypothetical protein